LRDERAVTWLSAARSPSTAAATRQPPQLPAWPPHLRQARRGLVDPHDVEQQAPVSRRRGHLEPDLGRRAGELVQRRRQAGAREHAEAVLRALPQRARARYDASRRSTPRARAASLPTSTELSALIHNGITGGGHACIWGCCQGRMLSALGTGMHVLPWWHKDCRKHRMVWITGPAGQARCRHQAPAPAHTGSGIATGAVKGQHAVGLKNMRKRAAPPAGPRIGPRAGARRRATAARPSSSLCQSPAGTRAHRGRGRSSWPRSRRTTARCRCCTRAHRTAAPRPPTARPRGLASAAAGPPGPLPAAQATLLALRARCQIQKHGIVPGLQSWQGLPALATLQQLLQSRESKVSCARLCMRARPPYRTQAINQVS